VIPPAIALGYVARRAGAGRSAATRASSRLRSKRVNFHSNGLATRWYSRSKGQDGALEGGRVGEVVGGEHLALHDGEGDLDLVEPGGVDRQVHQAQVRPVLLEALPGAADVVGAGVCLATRSTPLKVAWVESGPAASSCTAQPCARGGFARLRPFGGLRVQGLAWGEEPISAALLDDQQTSCLQPPEQLPHLGP
jgi:hypothetical protein